MASLVLEYCCVEITFFYLLYFYQGVPFPQNEANAMDVVIQFAIHKLGFQLNDIVIYAWSIGGFTGTRLSLLYTIFTFLLIPTHHFL